MLKFAIVDVHNIQHKVTQDDLVMVSHKKHWKVGARIVLDKVLLLGTKLYTLIGRPFVPGVRVHCTVEEQTKTSKVIIFKKKRRKGYRRTRGHRSWVTMLRVDGIVYDEAQAYEARVVESLTAAHTQMQEALQRATKRSDSTDQTALLTPTTTAEALVPAATLALQQYQSEVATSTPSPTLVSAKHGSDQV